MKTLTFLTLFLGLVWGRPMVELEAVDGTRRIELRLDGEVVAVVTGGPPWKAPVELGDELAPHHLVATAFDGDGAVLGRAEQWLNLPRALAEVQILLDTPGWTAEVRDPSMPPAPAPERVTGATARIEWTAARHRRYRELSVTFDGTALPVEDPGAIPLPPFDTGSLHVLSAELTFPDDSTARADLAFGGAYGDEIATELSGVAVDVGDGRRLRSREQAGDWLRRHGEPLPVVAVDHGAADLFAVLDLGSEPQRQLVALGMARRMGDRGSRMIEFMDPATGEPRSRVAGIRLRSRTPLLATGMRSGDRLHLVRPQLEVRDDDLQLFAVAAADEEDEGGSAWRLALQLLNREPGEPQQLADAVATVGQWAMGRSRPRAVILVLGPEAEDRSHFRPATVRRYLDRLGVPLAVAYVELEPPPGGKAADRVQRLAAARERWGADVADIADAGDWIRFHDALRDRLDHQRVLWVRGRHLPRAVERAPDAPEWLRLIGRGAP